MVREGIHNNKCVRAESKKERQRERYAETERLTVASAGRSERRSAIHRVTVPLRSAGALKGERAGTG